METELKCEFCNKIFSNKSNLKYHIKTNKTCQIIQHQNNVINCEFCSKVFTEQTIISHNKTCKKILNEEIKLLQIEKDEEIKRLQIEKDEEIKRLQIEKDEKIKQLQMRILELETENKIYLQDREVVQKLALQPKITNTNNNDNRIKINNNFFDNPERMKQMINEKLTKDYISDGQKGIAQFACNNLLKDENGNMNYICSDPSRCIFKFQNSDGNIEKDVKAKKLTTMLIDAGIANKAMSVGPSLWTKEDGGIDSNKFETYGPYTTEIVSMQIDNSVFRNELACLTSL
jgi:hypothetical protein